MPNKKRIDNQKLREYGALCKLSDDEDIAASIEQTLTGNNITSAD